MLAGARGRLIDSIGACAVIVRARNLRRAEASFGLMWAGDWAATVAVGVIAFRHGGAAAVGLMGVVRLTPAALLTPFAAVVADRARRERVLAGVGATRAITLGAGAAITAAGGPVGWVYVALAAATVAQTLFRPAHSALLPTLCGTPGELTAANVVRGLLDSTATLVGPLCAALLLKLSGPAAVLVAAAIASAIAGVLADAVRYEAPPRLAASSAGWARQAVEGLRGIVDERAVALLAVLAVLQTFTRGALTVFTVVIAIKLLGAGAAGVGLLNAAIGAGAVIGSLLAALLVGRGTLARSSGVGIALWGVPLMAIAAVTQLWWAVTMLAVIGLGNAFVDVGAYTVLARLVDDAVMARVFAAFEGILTLGVAAGAVVTPLLISAIGIRMSLVAVGLVTPVAALMSWPWLRALDRRMRVRDADIALLQHIPMLRPLPEATIEQLAASLTLARVPGGETVFEQGDGGDAFYVIEEGHADVVIDGAATQSLGAGDGFGEIALIKDSLRTATVRATSELIVRGLSREHFVTAVTGYSPSARTADDVISAHLDRFKPARVA